MARRSGDEWYVGGLNGWKGRDVEVDLSFLPEGEYDMTMICDGGNADKIARDFRIENGSADSSKSLKVRMANGGGFTVKLTPRK